MRASYKALVAVGVVVLLGVLNIVNFSTLSNPFDYARITDVDYKAVVVDNEPGDNGKIIVTERLTYKIHAASKNNLFWELWRGPS